MFYLFASPYRDTSCNRDSHYRLNDLPIWSDCGLVYDLISDLMLDAVANRFFDELYQYVVIDGEYYDPDDQPNGIDDDEWDSAPVYDIDDSDIFRECLETLADILNADLNHSYYEFKGNDADFSTWLSQNIDIGANVLKATPESTIQDIISEACELACTINEHRISESEEKALRSEFQKRVNQGE